MEDIKGYEGLYAITSCGKVWSYKRKIFLKPTITGDGYCRVSLCKNGKSKNYYIHRLVAEAYIPNPEGKPQINHLSEIKTDNYINNLEWATAKENSNYGSRNKRATTKRANSVPVFCLELNKTFKSMRAAARAIGKHHSSIMRCITGQTQTCGGYHFMLLEENKQ